LTRFDIQFQSEVEDDDNSREKTSIAEISSNERNSAARSFCTIAKVALKREGEDFFMITLQAIVYKM